MKLKRWIVPLMTALAVCGSMKVFADDPECTNSSGHYFEYYIEDITRYDSEYHYAPSKCIYCGYAKEFADEHEMEWDYNKALDGINHADVHYCKDCGYKEIDDREKHDFSETKCLKIATPSKKGQKQFICSECGYKGKKVPITWEYMGKFCQTYDISDHSWIYEGSKSITVKIPRALKGAVLKVKIGNKLYTKKLKSNSNSKKRIKFKIGHHTAGSRISIRLYYKNKIIGKDLCEEDYVEKDYVWYAKRVKNGMTKTQVRWTWGKPRDTSSSSDGYQYWSYDDGSSVRFHNGRVDYWYDAAG